MFLILNIHFVKSIRINDELILLLYDQSFSNVLFIITYILLFIYCISLCLFCFIPIPERSKVK